MNKLLTSRRNFLKLAGGAVLGAGLGDLLATETDPVDVCVYGATASGIMAAVASAREGCRVLLVEPSRWLGGMTGGGLSAVDWGRKAAVGGSTLEIMSQGYNDAQYRARFLSLLQKNSIPVLYEHRLASVQMEQAQIRKIVLDFAPPDSYGCPMETPKTKSAAAIAARVFIDCSYEGDLMAAAKVSYAFGREGVNEYGESLAGSQPPMAVYDIDPYVKAGDPGSGLLPLLQPITPPAPGCADNLTMGYGFRWKFSKQENRLPIEPPDHYDPRQFELYRRGFSHQVPMDRGRRMRQPGVFAPEGGHVYSLGAGNLARALWAPIAYGSNTDYPDGSPATRARIWRFQQDFMRQLTHFLRHDPAVPEKLRREAESMGFEPGIFDETHGWPHQLYVREARRMKSGYVVTQKDLAGETDPEDAIGLASYGVDEWPYSTYALDGKVALGGGYYSMLYLDHRHDGIYKIPYRSITPRLEECRNLLVPVCLSASHIAMTSIRMEPVWMILGESAGVAAALAVQARQPVQDVHYADLKAKLGALRQVLNYPL